MGREPPVCSRRRNAADRTPTAGRCFGSCRSKSGLSAGASPNASARVRRLGGLPPLGYDVRDRKLVVNEPEAETVRHICRRYAALGSMFELKDELDRDGIVSKARVDKFNRRIGGNPLARVALYLMLQNRIYRGEIVHKEASYPGEYAAFVDEALWEEVQRHLTSNRVDRTTGINSAPPSLLSGLIFDDIGERMTPSHANKKGTRYRYYVSRGLVSGGRNRASDGRRVPAGDLEALVEDRLRQFLANETKLFGAIEAPIADANDRGNLIARPADLAHQWSELDPSKKRAILTTVIDRIDLLRETLKIRIWPARLPSVLDNQKRRLDRNRPRDQSEPTITFTIPARLKRTGMETRLLIDGPKGSARKKPDHSLCRLLAQAQQ